MVSIVTNKHKKQKFSDNILYYKKARVKWHNLQSIWKVEKRNIYHRMLGGVVLHKTVQTEKAV